MLYVPIPFPTVLYGAVPGAVIVAPTALIAATLPPDYTAAPPASVTVNALEMVASTMTIDQTTELTIDSVTGLTLVLATD